MIRLAAVLVLLAGPVAAQSVADAEGAKLRFLDKLTGAVTDLVLNNGESKQEGRLTITLDGCRYNPENPAAEAYAHVTVLDANLTDPVFDGWMVASSPALSALDHPRYDVWVLRCDVPDLELPEVEPAPEDGGTGEGNPPATDDGNG
jgi:hypothetical protein